MRHVIYMVLSLAVFWLLNSGHYNSLLLSLGVLSIVIVLYIAHRMDVIDNETHPTLPTLKFPGYLIWLTKEIILSNILVVKHIWLGKNSISPTLKTIKASQKTEIGKVIYANSITLTPGTITVALEDDQFLVHALVCESIIELEAGEMDRRVSALEN